MNLLVNKFTCWRVDKWTSKQVIC